MHEGLQRIDRITALARKSPINKARHAHPNEGKRTHHQTTADETPETPGCRVPRAVRLALSATSSRTSSAFRPDISGSGVSPWSTNSGML